MARASNSLNKALQITAFRMGKRERPPPLPRSSHKRGAITRWVNKLEGGKYIGKQSKKRIEQYYQKIGLEGQLRPYLFADGQSYSMARGLGFTVNDLLYNFLAKLDKTKNGGNNGSPSIFDKYNTVRINRLKMDIKKIAGKFRDLPTINKKLKKYNMSIKYIY